MTHQDREHFGRNILKTWQLFNHAIYFVFDPKMSIDYE